MVELFEAANNYPDKWLPKADTCFFNFKLPNYSSKEVLLLKIIMEKIIRKTKKQINISF